MHDLLSIPALLALAREMLVNELAPLLPGEHHADAALLADAIAIAGRGAEAADEPMRAILHELEEFYRDSLTHPALRAGSPLSRTAGEGTERSEAGEGEPALWRRFAWDLRNGAFEHSPLDRAARAILWRMTIAGLRRSNPNFLAANGFD
jgi:hypothetical protein